MDIFRPLHLFLNNEKVSTDLEYIQMRNMSIREEAQQTYFNSIQFWSPFWINISTLTC